MFGLIASLAQLAAQGGDEIVRSQEGAGTYDPNTGKFYNNKGRNTKYAFGSMLNPLGSIDDPYLTTGGKLLNVFAPGIGGLITGKKRTQRIEEARANEAAQYEKLRSKVQDLPGYEIAPEAMQQLESMQQTSQDLSAIGQEMVDIASDRSKQGTPEAAIARKNIAENTAEQLQAIQESGLPGGSSAIAQAGKAQQEQYRNLSAKDIAYRFQAENDFLQALGTQAGLEATGAQLEAQGLTGMISERDKQFQSDLDKQLTSINLDIARETGQQAQIAQSDLARQQAQSAFVSGAINTATQFYDYRKNEKLKNLNQNQNT